MFKSRFVGKFVTKEGKSYIMEMDTPYRHETEESALKDHTAFGFYKKPNKILLMAFEGDYGVGIPDLQVSEYNYENFQVLNGAFFDENGEKIKISFDKLLREEPVGRIMVIEEIEKKAIPR